MISYRRTLIIAPAILAVLAMACANAVADDLDNTTFSGAVTDSTGAAIVMAKIIAQHLPTGVERVTFSDSEGRYRVRVSEPGDYKLRASAPGFREEVSNQMTAAMGRTITVDLTLKPAGVSEQATVTPAGGPLVDTARTVVGDTIGKREIDELPLAGRDLLRLVFLLGGVAEAPLSTADLADEGRSVFVRGTPEEAGIFSLTGAPATSNNITIDGLDNNDDRAARERIPLNLESVAEVQVITNQYAAEYGRASGGRINIRTRGGSNSFGGDAYFYFGDESLNANTFFRNARGLGRVPQQQRREGVTLSGPIRRQKYFFLAAYERYDVTDFTEVRALVPVETNPSFPLPKPNEQAAPGSNVALLQDELSTPESRNLLNARADLFFSQSHNSSARIDLSRGANRRGFPGGGRLPDTILVEGRNSDSVSFIDNLVLSDSLVNQARFQLSRLLPRNSSAARTLGVVIEEPSRIIAGSFTGSDNSPTFSREEKRAQIQDSLSVIRGSHLLKAGCDVQFIRSTFTDLFAAGGQYTFETVEDFLAGRPRRFIQRFDTESVLSNNVVGLFLQDEWKARPNLTISLGLRWDNESILDDRDNFSPRLAVAWDPFGGKLSRGRGIRQPGRTVVRVGFGMFYNRALLRTIDDFSLGRSTLLVDSELSPAVLSSVQFPLPMTDRSLVDRFAVAETGFLRRISPGLEIPYTIQTGLGVERQVGRRLVATADYIFTRGAHLWRETNINAPILPAGFASFTEFLASRDFDNRPDRAGERPLAGASADIVRFDLGSGTSSTPGAIRTINGVRVLTLGLNAPRSSNISAALAAIRFLRPDPSLTQVEELESTGNSFYHGGIFSVRYSSGSRASIRAAYTISKLIDEGTTNTASPQDLFDRRSERALSLQDQRHRVSFSGLFQVPILRLDLAPILTFGSSRPFNVGAGFDRNLNDVSNDRPNFVSPLGRPVWRRPGSDISAEVKSALALAPIGSSGNLPRNYGVGPASRAINLRASRTFALPERLRLRTSIDVYNLFNESVFSFGSEFIDRDDADFLIPRRTGRPRNVELSLKLSF